MENILQKEGLRPLPPDSDYKLGAVFNLPPLSELPAQFSLGSGWIEDQDASGETDFCPSYSSCGMSELQEKVKLSRRWFFAALKAMTNDVEGFGSTMRDAMKAHQKIGAIEDADLNEYERNLPPDQARRIENYRKDLFEKAALHRKETYLEVSGPYDYYDTARAAIWKFRDKEQAVSVGVRFGWPLSQYILDTIVETGFGHMMYVTGWDEDGLKIVNSYGTEAGKGGKHRLTREVYNFFVPIFGAMMLVDYAREGVEFHLKHGMKLDDPFCKKLRDFLQNIFGIRRAQKPV